LAGGAGTIGETESFQPAAELAELIVRRLLSTPIA
jgi:hypothetical protein